MPPDSPADLLLAGEASHLSNADLLTVLMISTDAVERVLAEYPTLRRLEEAETLELARIPVPHPEQMSRLLAARELSRRFATERARRGTPVHSAQDAYQLLEPLLRTETREVVVALALDTKSRLLCAPIIVSIGTVNSVPLHPRELFRKLIRASASSCLVAHLHPNSGEPVPSPDDIILTSRLKEAADILGIPLNDHLVIGRGTYMSMADRGLLGSFK